MRRSEAALAVVGRVVAGEPLWLALWNERWGADHLVGGHRHAGEDPRACLVREIFEELGFADKVDCRITSGPLAHLEYVAWSGRARAETAYVMDMFAVALDDRAVAALESLPAARWLAAAEVRAGRCRDGRPVSPTIASLFDRAGIDPAEIAPPFLAPEIAGERRQNEKDRIEIWWRRVWDLF